MRKIIISAALIFVLSSCRLFLGPDHDSSPMGIFSRIWHDFNETYALFDERLESASWGDVYRTYSAHISPDMTNFELFQVCAEMINTLNDPHVSLMSPFSHSDFYNLNSDIRKPFDLESVRKELESGGVLTGDGMFLYGKFEKQPRTGYLYIRDFINNSRVGLELTQEWAKEIDTITRKLQQETDFLVIDIRNNRGGFGSNMSYIANRFISEPRNYIKVSTKNGPGRNDFTAPLQFSIKPEGSRYSKPIVLLTNKWTASAAEWFAMALQTQDNVTHIGNTTNGAFSARTDRLLVNGWIYTMSIQKVTGTDGRRLEGVGISPNREHTILNIEGFYGWDPQLIYALTMF